MIEILKNGGDIQIVDSGRTGFRQFGVPVSGAMDLISSLRAQSILGNPIEFPLLEMYMPGHQFLFHKKTYITLTGAEARCEINGKGISMNSILSIQPNDLLSIHQMYRGSRVYMSIQGGLQIRPILNSCSPIPGYSAKTLGKGSILEYPHPQDISPPRAILAGIALNTDRIIECYPGPEWHFLNEDQRIQFIQTKWFISHQSNRMGLRTEGPIMIGDWQSEIYSSAVLPGTVQLLPAGKPILLMRDCQTTGGYPRILQVSEQSINHLGQRKPGDPVQFSLIDF